MLGIVLCGGQSLRMGTDKGLLSHQNKLWATLAADKLSPLGIPVKFSVNATQKANYTNYFDEEQLIVDHPSLDIKGPLLGVLSAHLANPKEDLFLLACDMLMMETRLLEKLVCSTKSTAFDAFIFKNRQQQEPLCGIYRSGGLKKILELLNKGNLAKHSMKYVLSNLNVSETPVEEKDYPCFGNFNSQEEVKGL